MDRQTLGRIGEEAVATVLAARGYVIIRRNLRTRYGEIDLVAAQGSDLVFVEVKTRTSGELGGPLDAIHPSKQRRLARLARAFMHERRLGERACRFDAAAVEVTREGEIVAVEIIKDAFVVPV